MSDQPQDNRGWRGPHFLREGRDRWIVGLILIVVGAVFLLQNLGFEMPTNWWAVFLLLPAAAAAINGVKAYNREGRITGGAAASFAIAAVLVLAAAVLLLDIRINWDLIWPLVLIAIGLGILLRSFGGRTR
ncbi:MAG: DUF5668 domain-containing protein [Bauldia sp.]